MSSNKTVDLAFLWRMHQPWYLDPTNDEVLLPWVRLHAASSYTDMAAHLASHPDIRATVSFSPVLLDQLDRYLAGGGDAYVDVTMHPAEELSVDQRRFLLRHFFSAHWGRVLFPVERYRELLDRRGRDKPAEGWDAVHEQFSAQDMRDLQVLFNLVWLGSTAAADDEIKALLDRGRDYTEQDKEVVLSKQRELIAALLPAWRALQQSGAVEIAATPYYHPVLPLVIDSDTARRPMPKINLPDRFAQHTDADLQIGLAMDRVEQTFGCHPAGLWPPEGAISPETVGLTCAHGVRYLATDARVLYHSLDERGSAPGRHRIYQPYRVGQCTVFFRDTDLSASIAREYPGAEDQQAAAEDFVRRVLRVSEVAQVDNGAPPLVLVALPGEHPWEAYPDRGKPFFDALYGMLSQHDQIRTVTLEQRLEEHPPTIGLDYLHSGSWVEGNFAMWIGDPEKNTAWNRLRGTRNGVTRGETRGVVSPDALEEARTHLLRAEGSDWFYWLGEPYYSAEGAVYEHLFKAHLMAAYHALGDIPPADLSRPIEQGEAVVPLRQPTAFIQPSMSGNRTSFFEWREAGFFRVPAGGSVYHEHGFLAGIYWGFDPGRIYLRLDPIETFQQAQALIAEMDIWIELTQPGHCIEARLVNAEVPELTLATCGAGCEKLEEMGVVKEVAVKEVIELSIPLSRMGLDQGARPGLIVHFERDGEELSRVPSQGVIEVEVPAHGYETGPSYKI